MKRNRDSQRSRVYGWERACGILTMPTLSLDECQDLATRARARYRKAPLRVFDGRSRRRGGAHGTWAITLPRFARSSWYTLHEVAHTLVPHGAAPHGPEFVRILLDLLGAFVPSVSLADARKKATEHRVKVARASAVPRPLAASVVKRIESLDAAIKAKEMELGALEEQRRALLAAQRAAA